MRSVYTFHFTCQVQSKRADYLSALLRLFRSVKHNSFLLPESLGKNEKCFFLDWILEFFVEFPYPHVECEVAYCGVAYHFLNVVLNVVFHVSPLCVKCDEPAEE